MRRTALPPRRCLLLVSRHHPKNQLLQIKRARRPVRVNTEFFHVFPEPVIQHRTWRPEPRESLLFPIRPVASRRPIVPLATVGLVISTSLETYMRNAREFV